MSFSTHLVVTLGESPQILTELVWWLRTIEDAHITAIEIWTTSSCKPNAWRLLTEFWNPLSAEVKGLPPLLNEEPPSSRPGVRMHILGDPPLADVRTREESMAATAALHDRLQTLLTSPGHLGAHEVLVGCVAGGRKTLSTALQTAFSLQARPNDRLVHVLQHQDVESHLKQSGQFAKYGYPTSAWAEATGVPADEQLVVYDVAFPRVKHLGSELNRQRIETLPWAEGWTELERSLQAKQAYAILQECSKKSDRRRWCYTCYDCDKKQVGEAIELGEPAGAVLAALSTLHRATNAQMLEHLRANHSKLGWPEKSVTDPARLAKPLHHLKQKLAPLTGLPHLTVQKRSKREFALPGDVRIKLLHDA